MYGFVVSTEGAFTFLSFRPKGAFTFLSFRPKALLPSCHFDRRALAPVAEKSLVFRPLDKLGVTFLWNVVSTEHPLFVISTEAPLSLSFRPSGASGEIPYTVCVNTTLILHGLPTPIQVRTATVCHTSVPLGASCTAGAILGSAFCNQRQS